MPGFLSLAPNEEKKKQVEDAKGKAFRPCRTEDFLSFGQ